MYKNIGEKVKASDLVDEVDARLRRQVAQQVHGPVQVIHGRHFTPHAVIEAPGTAVVYKAVAHPQACAHSPQPQSER